MYILKAGGKTWQFGADSWGVSSSLVFALFLLNYSQCKRRSVITCILHRSDGFVFGAGFLMIDGWWSATRLSRAEHAPQPFPLCPTLFCLPVTKRVEPICQQQGPPPLDHVDSCTSAHYFVEIAYYCARYELSSLLAEAEVFSRNPIRNPGTGGK